MNVNIAVSVFAAPGLSIGRQQSVTAASALFRGKTIPLQNLSGAPVNVLNLLQLLTSTLNVPVAVSQNLIFLRVLYNGQELDISKSLSENGVSNNNLLNVHVIAK